MKKIRTTTTKSLSALVVAALFVVVGFVTVPQAWADRFDDQIRALESEVSGFQNQVTQLRNQADTLQNALNVISAEKNTLQAQIDLNQAKVELLTAEIKANEEKLDRQKKSLNKTIVQIYTNSNTSPIVMLASSKSVSDYVNAQEIRGSVRDQMNTAMTQVKLLRAELAEQKLEIERVLADQTQQRSVLAVKESEQANLVAQTRGEEAAYQNLISNRNTQIDSLKAEQRAFIASLSTRGTNSGDPSKGGYTYNNTARPGWSMYGCWPDEWGMCARQCVSYTAFKVEQKTGYMPHWGAEYADAKNWPNLARKYGYETGSAPRVDSVAASTSGPWGHVMWVEQVNGNEIYVSQYNAGLDGEYSEGWVNAAGLTFIYF